MKSNTQKASLQERKSSPHWPSKSYWADSAGWVKVDIVAKGNPSTKRLGGSEGGGGVISQVWCYRPKFYICMKSLKIVSKSWFSEDDLVLVQTIFHRMNSQDERADYPEISMPELLSRGANPPALWAVVRDMTIRSWDLWFKAALSLHATVPQKYYFLHILWHGKGKILP